MAKVLKNTMIFNILFTLLGSLFLASCATGSAIITGKELAPVEPSEVRIYSETPNSTFENIGIVKATAEEFFSQQEALDRAINELKKQAAKIGANGVILTHMDEKQEYYSGFTPYATGGGHFYSGSDDYQVIKGQAIFVKD